MANLLPQLVPESRVIISIEKDRESMADGTSPEPGNKEPAILNYIKRVIEQRQEKMSFGMPLEHGMLMLNDQLRGEKEKAYDPKVVTIGPTHGVKGFDPNASDLGTIHSHRPDEIMKDYKISCLQQLLDRKGEGLKTYIEELLKLEEAAHTFYLKHSTLTQKEFLEMLLLDGFFVIELVRKYRFKDLRGPYDYIFQFDHVLSKVRHDLMLIKNQLPLVVVNTLFEMTKTNNPDDDLQYLFLLFVNSMIPWQQKHRPHVDLYDCPHLLELVYRSYFPFLSCNSWGEHSNNRHSHHHQECFKLFIEEEDDFQLDNINSISELKQMGIRLKKAKGIELKDISFMSGVMQLPQLNISDTTESILKNLMMYEQSFPNERTRYVTDYTFLMQCLVNSTKDVVIMRRSGIIMNSLGDDETVHRMLNDLGKNTIKSSEFCHSGLFKGVNAYCRNPRNRWMLIWNTNPLARLSFLVYILVILTAIQTIQSLLS